MPQNKEKQSNQLSLPQRGHHTARQDPPNTTIIQQRGHVMMKARSEHLQSHSSSSNNFSERVGHVVCLFGKNLQDMCSDSKAYKFAHCFVYLISQDGEEKQNSSLFLIYPVVLCLMIYL